MRIVLLLSLLAACGATLADTSPTALVEQQAEGYNRRDLEAFLAPYSEDIELYGFPDKRHAVGKAAMREGYKPLFEKYPKLHCESLNRIVMGNTVIVHERVTGGPTVIEAVAIYTIKDGKISRLTLMQ
jgi:hypothetical protein